MAAISERLATSELDYRRLASAHLDPWDGETPPDLAQLRSQLVEADQAVHAAVEALDAASANAEAIDRREVFLRRRAELAADRALLDDSDPTPVIEAVQEFDRATAVPSASDPRALELANKLADLESQRRQLATLVMTSDSSERRARATERLERSRL